jgi:hypothetical protein
MLRNWTRGKLALVGLVAAAAVVPSWLSRDLVDPVGESPTASDAEVDEAASTNGAEVPKSEVCRLVEQSLTKPRIQRLTPKAQTPNAHL